MFFLGGGGGHDIARTDFYGRTSCFLFYVPKLWSESEATAHFLYCITIETVKGLPTHLVSDNPDKAFLM